MRSTTDVALFFRAFFREMNRPVLAERPRSVNPCFLLAIAAAFPTTRRSERSCACSDRPRAGANEEPDATRQIAHDHSSPRSSFSGVLMAFDGTTIAAGRVLNRAGRRTKQAADPTPPIVRRADIPPPDRENGARLELRTAPKRREPALQAGSRLSGRPDLNRRYPGEAPLRSQHLRGRSSPPSPTRRRIRPTHGLAGPDCCARLHGCPGSVVRQGDQGEDSAHRSRSTLLRPQSHAATAGCLSADWDHVKQTRTTNVSACPRVSCSTRSPSVLNSLAGEAPPCGQRHERAPRIRQSARTHLAADRPAVASPSSEIRQLPPVTAATHGTRWRTRRKELS
jgi:hypothetical protein